MSADEATWGTARLRRFVAQLEGDGVPWIKERTVAIYALVGDTPIQFGTGVLLRIADTALLISAAHVLKASKTHTLLLSPGEREDVICLNEMEVCWTKDEDDIDFGIIRLSQQAEAILSRLCKFVRLSDVSLEDAPAPPGWYSVFGYPKALAATDRDGEGGAELVTSNALYYCTFLNEVPLERFTHGVSIALSFPPDNMDGDGNDSEVPDPRGISGCGIWRMHTPVKVPDQWNAERVRLVGIQHSVVRRKAIKGVLIKQVLANIAFQHPDLRPAIELIF